MFWNPLESHHIGQSLDDLGAAPASFGTHQQALPRVFIDQVQHPHRPSVMGGSAHEVIAPDVVRPFWAQPHTRPVVEPQPPSWLLSLWYLQPFTTPDPLHPVLAHSPPRMLEQRRDPAIAITAILAGQGDDGL